MDSCRSRACSQRPFGRTIAHGYLSLSLVPALLFECLEVTGYAPQRELRCQRGALPGPGPLGERVRASARINEVKPVEGGHQLVIGR